MRELSVDEIAAVVAPEGCWIFANMRVQNYGGGWLNLGALAIGTETLEFFNEATLDDDKDRNTLSMTAQFAREIGNHSLVPFRSDSDVNNYGGSYQLALDVARRWDLWVAVVARGVTPVAGDYREQARGWIDRIDVSGEPAIITVQGRGEEATLIDRRIVWGDTPNVPISASNPKTYATGLVGDVIQQILDKELGGGAVLLTVDASVDPLAAINGWDQIDEVGMFDLITQTASLRGMNVRYRYDDDDVLSLTLFTPNRSPTTPDWSLDAGPGGYEKLDTGIDLAPVRNYVVVQYADADFGTEVVTSPASPISPSISRYKLRVLPINLASSTQVTAQDAAGALADAIRADLEFPILEQAMEATAYWFAELGDYVQFTANGIHYDEDQFGGVVALTQRFSNAMLTTSARFTAKPVGRYRGWLDFGPGVPRAQFTPGITKYDADYWETYAIDGVTLTAGGVMDLGEVNGYTRSVAVEVGTDSTFATVEFIEYTDVTAGGTFTHQWEGASRASIYYFRATPWSGPLSGGLPTGVAGPPALAQTYLGPRVPTKPEFDTAVADIRAEPFTVYDDPANLTAARKWVDGVGTTINLATPDEIAIDVPGASAEAAGAGAGVYELSFFDYGSAQEPLANIPSAFTEITSRLRRAALLAGMGTMRLVGNVVELAGGSEKIRIGYASAGGSSFTDPGTGADLPLNRLGVVRSDWMAVPGGMASDVDVSPHVLGGNATRRARLTSLKMQCSPTTRAGGITPPIGSGGTAPNYHYDAQALVGYSDEDPVTTWVDADNPGAGHDAAAGNGSFPGHYDTGVMNGYPGVRIESLGGNARGYYLPSAFAPTEGEAIMVVRAGGGGPFWHFGPISLSPSMPTTSGGTMADHFGSSVLRSFTIGTDPTVPFVYRVRAKAGEWTCWVNGVQKFTTATNTTSWNISNFGMFLSGGAFANSFDGWFGELFFRSSHYSSTDAAALETLLFSKWGITP